MENLETLEVNDKRLKISATDGMLSVEGQTDSYLIQEASMKNYELFYKAYVLAFLPVRDNPELTFTELWCFDKHFRSNIVEALKHLGFNSPEDLRPAQLEALLVSYQNQVGLLFQLHNTYPKLQGGWKMMNLQESRPQNSPYLRLLNSLQSLKIWVSMLVVSLYPGL